MPGYIHHIHWCVGDLDAILAKLVDKFMFIKTWERVKDNKTADIRHHGPVINQNGTMASENGVVSIGNGIDDLRGNGTVSSENRAITNDIQTGTSDKGNKDRNAFVNGEFSVKNPREVVVESGSVR